MPITYLSNTSNKAPREPLTKRIRSFYRSPRKGNQENLFNQKLCIDINRIHLELELIDTAILNKIKILLGVEKEDTHEIKNVLNEVTGEQYYGRIYDLSSDLISLYDYQAANTVQDLETMDTIGGSLSKLFFKINQLEKQTG